MDYSKSKLNSVFWISAMFIAGFVIIGSLFPATFGNWASIVYEYTASSFGWLYLLAIFLFVVFLFFIAFSKFGKIKLGKANEKPDYPLFTWIGMLFSAGFGIALVFYGVGEPMTHFFTPPMQGVEPLSEQAARLSMDYSFFHYGVSQWSIFAIVGLCMAYFQYRKNKNGLVSTSLEPLIGNKRRVKPIKRGIDILAIVATITGIATSIGLGVAQMNGGLHSVIGVSNGTSTQLIIIVVMTVLFIISSTTGLNRGIKWLSNINLTVAIALMLFVFITGPTVFILETFTVALGDYFSNFISYSLRLTPYSGNTWVKEWTVFYWAWVIAWSPFVGAFVARISRGRTIREFVLGVMVAPPAIALVWMAIFGGTSLYMDLFEGANIAAAVNNDITSALFTTFQSLPLSNILSVTALFLIMTFLVTSADSAVYILSSMSSNGSQHPPLYMRIIWGILLSSIAGVLLISSGLQGLQTASLVAALPFTVIALLMATAFFKSIRNDLQTNSLEQKETVKQVKEKNKKEKAIPAAFQKNPT
ncbi:BCCT family transporter [Bacillus kwashiorkori]|uniref:BCCT family transporter n=1 Tax=Bacillus kwashiorkori TaxID=1522318 RepID=UPI000783EF90|nr:BCCT family transporter [Bacillus kwashiorkori]